MGGWVDGYFDIFDILLKPPQPFTGLFSQFKFTNFPSLLRSAYRFSTNTYCNVFGGNVRNERKRVFRMYENAYLSIKTPNPGC